MPSLTDPQIDAARDAEALVRLLIDAGEELPPRLHERILTLGPAVIPPLVAMLEDDALSMEEAPGEGWAPIHAADLLGELRKTETVEPMLRRLARETHLVGMHRRVPPNFADDRRTIGLVAIASDAAPREFRRIDAGERARKPVHEVPARLLAVGDQIDTGMFLLEERDAGCVALRLAQCSTGQAPIGPEPLGLGEPCRFWQTARNRRRKEHRGRRRLGLVAGRMTAGAGCLVLVVLVPPTMLATKRLRRFVPGFGSGFGHHDALADVVSAGARFA